MRQTTRADRGQGTGSSQVFRDVASLLLVALLAVSVRFDRAEGEAVVEPLPVGVQAAELEEAADPAVEPAATPAVPCPKALPAALQPAPFRASPVPVDGTENLENRRLILRDGAIHEIRLTARFEAREPSPECGGQRVTLQRS